MQYSEAKQSRIFVLRLEDGDIIHETIEKFAIEKQIKTASIIALGGIDKGSVLIVGPKEGRAEKIVPMEITLDNTYEATGTGTIFPDKDNNPVLHMHLSAGRKNNSLTGCIRKGVKVWHVFEVIISEIIDTPARRIFDKNTGFELLQTY